MNILGRSSPMPFSQPLMQGIQQTKQFMSMLSGTGNPMQALTAMVGQNPVIGQVMQMCRMQNPEQVFRNMCRQKGIDADAFVAQLKQ